jgi:hypothetical protein
MEQTHQPGEQLRQAVLRRSKLGADMTGARGAQIAAEAETH